ncbi:MULTISPECIES: hypothetical protein [Citrobacter]|nr:MULTISPECIES: hypothetical protein [Citrobacter]MBD0828916.1 hypothetical protein [Citrobacter sp. C1]
MSLKRRLLAQEDKLTELKVRCERGADIFAYKGLHALKAIGHPQYFGYII